MTTQRNRRYGTHFLPKIATVSSKGQITILVRYRRHYGIKPGDKIELEVVNDAIHFRPARSVRGVRR